jgi:hypothetical protein
MSLHLAITSLARLEISVEEFRDFSLYRVYKEHTVSDIENHIALPQTIEIQREVNLKCPDKRFLLVDRETFFPLCFCILSLCWKLAARYFILADFKIFRIAGKSIQELTPL